MLIELKQENLTLRFIEAIRGHRVPSLSPTLQKINTQPEKEQSELLHIKLTIDMLWQFFRYCIRSMCVEVSLIPELNYFNLGKVSNSQMSIPRFEDPII